jgi:hypothetical protein
MGTTTTSVHRLHPTTTPGVPVSTEIATLTGTAPAFGAPGGAQVGTVPATWDGGVSALPVLGAVPGWLEVQLAQAPNGSAAWIPAAAATLSRTGYYVVVELGAHRLELYDQGMAVLDAPADLGSPQSPTPYGTCFVAFFAQAPNAGYGPFVIVTSAHVAPPGDWEQGADALVTIRGPLADDAAIGTTGANGTGGSVGLHVTDLSALRPVPAGTVVDIRN